MKKLFACLALAAASLMTASPLMAADVVPMRAAERQENQVHVAVVSQDSAPYTNSTTTASDIPGLTVTVPQGRKADLSRMFYRVCYFADASKATSTNGAINVVVNGTTVTAATRQLQFGAGRSSLTSCHVGTRPTLSPFIIKLQGVSGDTAAFTINAAQMRVEVFYAN